MRVLIATFALAFVLGLAGGCSTSEISAADQSSKQKEIDEATKKLNAEAPPKEAGQQGD